MTRSPRLSFQTHVGTWVATLDLGWMGWKPEPTWLRWAPWYGFHWLLGGISFVRIGGKPALSAGVQLDIGTRGYNMHVRTMLKERL